MTGKRAKPSRPADSTESNFVRKRKKKIRWEVYFFLAVIQDRETGCLPLTARNSHSEPSWTRFTSQNKMAAEVLNQDLLFLNWCDDPAANDNPNIHDTLGSF